MQQLAEMEEIVQYQTLCVTASRETAHNFITHLRQMWANRLRGCQRNVDVRLSRHHISVTRTASMS